MTQQPAAAASQPSSSAIQKSSPSLGWPAHCTVGDDPTDNKAFITNPLALFLLQFFAYSTFHKQMKLKDLVKNKVDFEHIPILIIHLILFKKLQKAEMSFLEVYNFLLNNNNTSLYKLE